jgi:uncharacterized membrane protein YfcA
VSAFGAEELLIIAAAFVAAGVVKGTIGMGLPTTLVSLLAQFLDPRMAIALLLVPAVVTNVWQVYRAGGFLRSARELWPFGVAMALALWPATRWAAAIAADRLAVLIGVMILVFAGVSLMRAPPRIPPRFDRVAQVTAGGVAGVIGGLTSIWSPPMVIYLLGRGSDKDDFIRFAGFIILVGTVPLTAGYWRAGLFDADIALTSTLMILPVLAGFSVGERLRSRMNAAWFRRGVLLFFCVMGLNLIRRAF